MAVGGMGLRYDDFCSLTPGEFSYIYRAYSKDREAQRRDNWERMRMLAAITIQPYAKKGMTPQKLLRFPWDKESGLTRKTENKPVSKAEALKRFEEALKMVGKG